MRVADKFKLQEKPSCWTCFSISRTVKIGAFAWHCASSLGRFWNKFRMWWLFGFGVYIQIKCQLFF